MAVALALDGFGRCILRNLPRFVEMYELGVGDEDRGNKGYGVSCADNTPGRAIVALHSHRKDVSKILQRHTRAAESV